MPRSPLNGNDVYAAEKIVASRVRNGELQYRIRWKDFSSYYDTWEPATNILDNRLITFFEAGRKPTTTTVKRRRRRGPFLGLKRRRLNAHVAQVESTPATSKSQPDEQVDSDLKLVVDQTDDDDSTEESTAVLDDTDDESTAVLDSTDDESIAVLDSTAEDEELHSVEVIKEVEEEEEEEEHSVKEKEEKQDAEEKRSLETEEEVNKSELVVISEEKQNESCSGEESYEHSVSPLPPALSPQLPDSGPSTSSDGDYLPPTTRTLTVITDRLFYFSSVKLTEVVHNGVKFSFAEF
ncbi:Polycomb group protein Pc [Trichinella spiralis]|uniref:Polycomb group protein Pc n=1 Tax=Trichinella spiralis TaxID=6334 RepID=A0ABR3KD27_TRISP